MTETKKTGGLPYRLIRSRRKTLAMEITPDGLVVRAPLRTPQAQIDAFLRQHEQWLKKHAAKLETAPEADRLSPEELRALAERALDVIPKRVAYYAPLVGVTWGRITIRNQRTKWGSCSAKGNLNFNCLLMLAPPEVLDSVVVHELCHRKYLDHSREFYAEVLRVFPEYRTWDRWLKENGMSLLRRLP